MEPQRIYLIGAGVIAQWHASAAAKLPRTISLFVTDPSGAAIDSFTARFPDTVVANDIGTMLSVPSREDDIVVVAAPPFTHHTAAISALDSGRHTLCEKPLAMNIAQATEMYRHAKAANRLIGCCSCRFLGHPVASEVKELLRSGKLGSPYHVRWVHKRRRARPGIEYQPDSKWFLDPTRSGGGVVMDWGPYDFAALNDLLSPGEVVVQTATLASPITNSEALDTAVEQHCSASLSFRTKAGSIVPVTYERAACTHGEETSVAEIECARGSIRWDWIGGKLLSVTTDDHGAPNTRDEERSPHPLHPHERPLLYFDAKIRGESSPAIVSEQAIFNFSCIRAIYDAATTGQPQTVRFDN